MQQNRVRLPNSVCFGSHGKNKTKTCIKLLDLMAGCKTILFSQYDGRVSPTILIIIYYKCSGAGGKCRSDKPLQICHLSEAIITVLDGGGGILNCTLNNIKLQPWGSVSFDV